VPRVDTSSLGRSKAWRSLGGKNSHWSKRTESAPLGDAWLGDATEQQTGGERLCCVGFPVVLKPVCPSLAHAA
jgi:hypothetical protein